MKIAGEAKRRYELGLTPRKKIELHKFDRYFSLLPITKLRIKKISLNVCNHHVIRSNNFLVIVLAIGIN